MAQRDEAELDQDGSPGDGADEGALPSTDYRSLLEGVPDPFDAVLGQGVAVESLRRAIAAKRLHHAYRFEGPDGVGKELTAMALALRLLCPHGPLPCPACRARVLTVSDQPPQVPLHPSLHVVQRGLYRTIIDKDSANEISVHQVRRVVIAPLQLPPQEGGCRVVLVRDAHHLNASSANALLKILEEPPPDTHFILVTSRPHQLLDTILSRSLPLRFGPLPDETLRQILSREGRHLEDLTLAQGSAAEALRLSSPEIAAERQRFVQQLLNALNAPSLEQLLEFAEQSWGDRGALRPLLSAAAAHFAAELRHSADDASWKPRVAAASYDLVLEAQRRNDHYVNATRNLEALGLDLRALRAVPSAAR